MKEAFVRALGGLTILSTLLGVTASQAQEEAPVEATEAAPVEAAPPAEPAPAEPAPVQAAPTPAPPPPATTQPVSEPKEERELTDEEEDQPMNWAGIGLRLGVMGVSRGKLNVEGISSNIDRRTGFLAVMPINLGGSGIGWTIDPYYFNSSIHHKIYSGELTGGEKILLDERDVTLHTLGIGGGPTILIHVTDRWFVGTAVTMRWGWTLNDTFKYAFDLYGRIPLNVTWYPSGLDDIGFVAEFGFGYGGTGLANKPEVTTQDPDEIIQQMVDQGIPLDQIDQDAIRNQTVQVDADFKFGLATTWDFSVGIRWP